MVLISVPVYMSFVPYLLSCAIVVFTIALAHSFLSTGSCIVRKTVGVCGGDERACDDTDQETAGYSFFVSIGLWSTHLVGYGRTALWYVLMSATAFYLYERTFFYQTVWEALRVPLPTDERYLGIFSSTFLSLMIIAILGILYLLVGYVYARYPNKDHGFVNDPEFLTKIGCVIPCHKSEDEIQATLRSVGAHIPWSNIIVVDNANNDAPPDKTQQMVSSISPLIKYIYIPQGLKTRAIWEGMKVLPRSVEYIIHIDDDTILPDDMVFDATHFEDPRVSGVSYGISMMGPNIVQRLVDFEFLLFSQW
eukprot:CAMPEP_0197522432 /NCGR_PEP_ID=MMETSP1318-20131121/7582_1 /TAXON_ID=552666 /ORGANISM="Partenskyella glossopodia, Strain RCC365" /LENGTH=306 /DNA_ID=CAMNT_0043074817 /DNA_START=193 /DNA_END=1110 /DNA_ORIENTATION=+